MKIHAYLKRLAVYFLLSLVLATSFVINLPKAYAAKEKTTNKFNPALARFWSPDSDNIYFDGQKITVVAKFNQSDLKVWADLSVIDRNMSSNYLVVEKKGVYTLTTPILSNETMMPGKWIMIPFKVETFDGKLFTVKSTYAVRIMYKTVRTGSSLKKPAKVKVEAGDSRVILNWSAVTGANSYLVTFQDQDGVNRQIYVPKTDTKVVINNLQNGFNYTFLIAAKERKLGLTETVSATPFIPAIETKKTEAIKPAIGRGIAVKIGQPAQDLKTKDEIQKANDQSSIKVETKSPEQSATRNWNRILVAISILIIALGAAIGGYYGYEWWSSQKESNKEKPKSNNSSSRW